MNSGVSQFPNHATETESKSDPNDSWLERSERRSTRQDPDFEVPEEKFEDINIVLKTVPNPLKDRTFLVFESHLKNLMNFCPKCGAVIESSLTTENMNEGSQGTFKLHCLSGCDTVWSTQPRIKATKGYIPIF